MGSRICKLRNFSCCHVYFVLLGQAIVNRQWKVTPLNVLLNIILAILSMLLVEHVSLYLLFVTVYFSIIYYLKI